MARQLRLKLDALIKDSGASEHFVGIEHLPSSAPKVSASRFTSMVMQINAMLKPQ
jgi:hypothetical protein